jgi:hypothetical protein
VEHIFSDEHDADCSFWMKNELETTDSSFDVLYYCCFVTSNNLSRCWNFDQN